MSIRSEWNRGLVRKIVKAHRDVDQSAGIEMQVQDVVAERDIHGVGACSTTSWRHRSHTRMSVGAIRKVCRNGRLAARADRVEAGCDRRPFSRYHACAGTHAGRTCRRHDSVVSRETQRDPQLRRMHATTNQGPRTGSPECGTRVAPSPTQARHIERRVYSVRSPRLCDHGVGLL